ncbi:MAG: DNA mismatch endonuclease Vsr [Bacteroidales bacterium]|nr:DNA mismatch endonuclease Vsr [Bacteroidales bacterium]
MDSLTKEHRSWNMSRIRSANTKPEMLVRSYLHRNGFRFRLHVKNLPGHPDIVLPRYKTVVEVRGCFWHRHPGCKATTSPSSNTEFWEEKFKRNVERDKQHAEELKVLGWNLIVVWECETSKKAFPPKELADFVTIKSSSPKKAGDLK